MDKLEFIFIVVELILAVIEISLNIINVVQGNKTDKIVKRIEKEICK